MPDLYTRVSAAAASIRERFPSAPAVGVILGSGLGDFAGQVTDPVAIPYREIPGFPESTVVGHSGQLVLGRMGGSVVAVMQGRVHAYEGYPMEAVTFPTRVLAMLGCRTLIVTNAAGGILPSLRPGQLCLITDHINLTGTNAALGPNESRFGERFFDMSAAYSTSLQALARSEAKAGGVDLAEGVYLAVLGPSFETPAEIRAFRTLGADLVGMSTVHEVIVARHMGLEVLGLSLVTNMAAGTVAETIDHKEVLEIGRRVQGQFTAVLTAVISRIGSGSVAGSTGDESRG